MRKFLAGSLGLSLGLLTGTASAQAPADRPVIAATPGAAVAAAPAAFLGRPVPLAALGTPVAVTAPKPPQPIVRAQMAEPGPPSLAPPTLPALPPVRPTVPATPAERYNCGVVTTTAGSGGFWDNTKQTVTGIPQAVGGMFVSHDANRGWFESDHSFDGFISPV